MIAYIFSFVHCFVSDLAKRDCCKTEVLQQSSFSPLVGFYGARILHQNVFRYIWDTAKLTGRVLTVWLWKTFCFYLLRSFFLRIMRFQPSFFAASSTVS